MEEWDSLLVFLTIPLFFLLLYNFINTIYVIIFGLFIGLYLIHEPVSIRIIDILIAISAIGYFQYRILKHDMNFNISYLDRRIILFMCGISLSLINVSDYSISFISLLHHIELFLALYIFTKILFYFTINKIYRLLHYFLYVATVVSIFSICQLYVLGTGRAFGITGAPLADLIVSALIIVLSFLYLSKTIQEWVKYSTITFILFMQIILMQTRGAWLSLILSLILLIIILNKRSIQLVFKNTIWLSILFIIAINTSSILFNESFIGITHKIEQIENFNVGTLQTRLILWEAAINAFILNPINGIGIGQFPHTSTLYSSLGNTKFFIENIKGLSAHNTLLSYLSETGFIGIFCLIIFYIACLRMGIKIYNDVSSPLELKISIPLLINIFFVIVSSFYAGSWFWSINGVHFMFFLGITVSVAQKIHIND